ncbi:PaaX family transcriptional regulator [Specibacter sp. RAF43]|uniref:PaaX family transcriptional regulator n=1 Tax=Specibacter sp. RAF43 TaxID=3233057 RepID=UPI003F9A1B62
MGEQLVGEETAADLGAISVDGWLEPPQPQDLMLTVLADNVRHRAESVWSGGLVRLLGDFGFSTGASRVALSRMARRGLIAPRKQGRVVRYELSDRLERLLAEGDAKLFGDRESKYLDDDITVLLHTLPEDMRLERSRLARGLRFRGFGTVQDGTWIAPGDREEEVLRLATELGITGYCSLVVGHLSRNPKLSSLVERAWDLAALNRRYEEFVEMFGSIDPLAPASDAEAFLNRTQIMHNFRQFPFLDPGMGGALFPVTSKREDAIAIFHRVYGGLREPAQRHFDLITALDKGVR